MKTIRKSDSGYPYLLREIYNAPGRIFVKGDLGVLKKTCVSVVGTRKCSDYGEMMVKKIVADLAALDVVIVSGLALGIDTMAHKEALKNGLNTIAVLGSGLRNVYPKSNYSLAERIERNGLLISEYSEDEDPKKMNFPARNRIISGLSVATIVIEAPEKSGALITAKFALDQGREIFVVPGDVDRVNSQGILNLLQYNAAYPVRDGKDVIEVLKRQPYLFSEEEVISEDDKEEGDKYFVKTLNLEDYEKEVFLNISESRRCSLESIIKKVDLPAQKILAAISLLEIKGLIACSQGKYRRKI